MMPISNIQQRAGIGFFNATSKRRFINKKYLCMFGSVFCFLSFFIIELNAGPTDRDSCYNFSIFHWNSNSITGHNFAKLNPLHACYAIHKLDIICLSESFLDLSVPSNNDNLYRKD